MTSPRRSLVRWPPEGVLGIVERLLFESSRTVFLMVLLAIAFCKTGVWIIPNLGLSRLIALDPFTNPIVDPYAQYLYWNWLGPFAAWLVGATGRYPFVLFHLAFAVAFTVLFAWTIFRRLPEREARVAFLVFSVLPASGTIYYWVGMDAIVLFLMLVPLVFSRSLVMPLLAGIALGLQHFEQGVVAGSVLLMTLLVAARMRLAMPYRPAFAIAWIVGTIIGKLVLIVLFARWSAHADNGRLMLFGHEGRMLLLEAAFHGQAILWSALGVGWFVMLGYVDPSRREAMPLVAGILACLPFLVLAQDETRVFAILTFPLLTAWWLFDRQVLSRMTGRDAAIVFVVWLLVPWSWTWLGIPRWSALPYDLYRLMQKFFGPFPDVPLDAMKLFG